MTVRGALRVERVPSAGFSLVELVLVMIVLSVLAAIAIPRLPQSGSATLTPAAERFAADLRRARLLAMTQFRSLCVSLDGSAGYFVSQGNSATCSATPVDDPISGVFRVELPDAVSITRSACSGSVTADCQYFRFRSNGAPTAGATFALSGGGKSINVQVAAVSGAVSVQ